MCLGKHQMNSSMDVPSAEECYKVDSIIRHEGFVYEQDRTDITNDIALVHLVKPVNITKEISPICLPQPWAVMPAGTPCFVTGWGDEKGRSDLTFQFPVKEISCNATPGTRGNCSCRKCIIVWYFYCFSLSLKIFTIFHVGGKLHDEHALA